MAGTPYAENLFLIRWVATAQKQKRFLRSVAIDMGFYAGTPDFSVITVGIECLAGQGIALVLLSYQLQL
ncbi:hypothetical protein [Serratia marcescens]|uniref:hypothetical protein n=1 Tax=Serratia marcescens TaxID=615 RepID=UPI00396F589C